MNPIVETYSRLAGEYDDDSNLHSCWGKVTEKASTWAKLSLKEEHRLVVDVGCGTGRELHRLAQISGPEVQFIGLDPAPNMCRRAAKRLEGYPNVSIKEGGFENLPLDSHSVDYLFSILAFHWTTDLERSVREIARVLKPQGEMDLVFIGRYNGQEFIKKTTPVFLKHMGLAAVVESARMRKQISREAALELFGGHFNQPRLSVDESYKTYYDTLEGHWSWWVRVEGHFLDIPRDKKERCDREVKQAIATLENQGLIPYTVHLLHVKLRKPQES